MKNRRATGIGWGVAAGVGALATLGALVRGEDPRPPSRDAVAPTRLTRPVRFDTPEADRILARLQVFPPDNPWNEDVSGRRPHPNSAALVASVGLDKPLAYNLDMAFILVPSDQKRVPVTITKYPDESDPGPFPVPDDAPIEGWPLSGIPLETLQREGRGDRHVIVVDPMSRMLYEFFEGRRTDRGWTASQASVFDLKSNRLRPEGWTSSDAAGLPIFPAVVRYDELESGQVRHAMRFTIRHSRRAYVYPATHHASRKTDENLPRMGERFRLRRDFDTSGFSPHPRALLEGLKRYGMFVADNGGEWRISVAPDARIQGLDELRRVKGRDFEVVEPAVRTDGPRRR